MPNPVPDPAIVDAYRSAIGRPRRSLATPALILDLEVARQNIRTMAQKMRSTRARLRPHIKGQKSPQLARLQVDAGAIGVCTATVWEAIVMSRAGIEDVLVANEVVGPHKIAALAQAAKQRHITVAVDDARNVQDLSAAMVSAHGSLDLLIEVDVGMQRGGVRSPEEAVALAQRIASLPGVRLRGVQGYEGHMMLVTDRGARTAGVGAATSYLAGVVQRLEDAGFPCEVVSAGGTGTYDITSLAPRVTEIQAGSYVFMDNFHRSLISDFGHALTVLGTVVAQHGQTIILDTGIKSIGVDHEPATMVDYPGYQARSFAEEHALFDVDERCKLALGDTVELIPGYAPSTVNLYDVYHVVEGGVVVDIWPVTPRGPGHGGLASA